LSELKISRETIDTTLERQLTIYAITDTKILGMISKIWKPELAKSPYSEKVIRWCIEHFNVYGNAPGKNITDIYMTYRQSLDNSIQENIGMFLHSLNGEYVSTVTNSTYIQDRMEAYIRQRAVEVFQNKLTAAVTNKDYIEAERLISTFNKLTASSHDTVSFTEMSEGEIISAFDDNEIVLFTLPHALGKMIGPVKATDFVHILSPAKMGKSWFLQWIGINASIQGCNVLEINLEMQKTQRIRRWWRAVNASPKYDSNVDLTYFYQDEENGLWKVGNKTERRKAVDLSSKSIDEFKREYKMQFPTGDYRMQCHIAKQHTVNDIRNMLINMSLYDGYTPDVLILDHPALLKHGGKGRQGWEDIGDLYAELRGLATEFNLALITASHSTRNSYKANVIDETMVGKSLDILAHITSGVSITSTKAEKEVGIYRASQLVEREGSTIADQIIITSCLDLGLPYTDSRFLSECDYTLPTYKDNEGGKDY